jgi:hypothetical protein
MNDEYIQAVAREAMAEGIIGVDPYASLVRAAEAFLRVIHNGRCMGYLDTLKGQAAIAEFEAQLRAVQPKPSRRHSCGARGFGLGSDDVCDGCVAEAEALHEIKRLEALP